MYSKKRLRKMEAIHRKMNKNAYKRYKRHNKISIKKAAWRFFIFAAAEIFLYFLLFKII